MKRWALLLAILIVLAPVFGVVLANAVGYHEPLDVAAEKLGLNDITEEINWTPLLDYTVPGLPDVVGYAVSGAIGVVIVVVLGHVLMRVLRRR